MHHPAPTPRPEATGSLLERRAGTDGRREPHSCDAGPTVVNDRHSGLNPTLVSRLLYPRSRDELQEHVRRAAATGETLAIAGGRHAMGGQQFAAHGQLLDCRGLDHVLDFDPDTGTLEVEAGIEWPELKRTLRELQPGQPWTWTFAQKQTGADRLTLGGSLAANVHGRGLRMGPIIRDVEALTLVGPDGELVRCSRRRNRRLFHLAIGGYGLFGPIYSVTLRLVPRRKLVREVEIETADQVVGRLEERAARGYLFGDFQFDIDPESDGFLDRGVLACYRPVELRYPLAAGHRALSSTQWEQLVYLAHRDKSAAFELYSEHYLSTHGQVYWSDDLQMTTYLDGYHERLDRRLEAPRPSSEVITELFVPRPALARFLERAAAELRERGSDLIYGTVRLVERDRESFLAWAREPWACVIFNLHTEHSPSGLEASACTFRRLIDLASALGGSYYLTYHRHATRQQVDACYPQFRHFLRTKRHLDPEERFQSEWYRHMSSLYAGTLGRGSTTPQRD